MSLRRFFAVIHGVSCVSSRRVGVVCSLLMVSGVVVLGRFTVMMRGVRMMFLKSSCGARQLSLRWHSSEFGDLTNKLPLS